MRVGLLGAGRMGSFHAATLHAHPDVEEIIVADADPGAAIALAAVVPVTPVETIADALGAGLDAVVIAAATSAHAVLIHAALSADVPVFCEKPVALDLTQTRAVVEHAARAGVPVQVGFQRRFDAGYCDARTRISSGELGRLQAVRMVAADRTPPPLAYLDACGGMFRDMQIHDFDLVRWLTGTEVAEVYATGRALDGSAAAGHGDVGTIALLLSMVDGVLITITGSRRHAAGYDVRAEISGSDGTLAIGLGDRTPIGFAQAKTPWSTGRPYAGFLDRFADAYRAELSGFLNLVHGRGANPCTAIDALEALRIAIAVERSCDERRPVRLAEVT